MCEHLIGQAKLWQIASAALYYRSDPNHFLKTLIDKLSVFYYNGLAKVCQHFLFDSLIIIIFYKYVCC